MPDLAPDEGRAPVGAPGPDERLEREVGILAGRLAALLRRSLPDATGPLADGCAFLKAMYEAVGGGEPLARWTGDASARRATPPHPIDRLVDGLRLSPCEADVVVLAGLAEAHEGFASILRAIHPRSEPRPTVGLAAQLFCHATAERRFLRATLEGGSAVHHGLVRLTPDAPFFERSLLLADGVWSTLEGCPVWPMPVLPVAVSVSGLEEWLGEEPGRRARAALRRRLPITVLVTAGSEDVALERGVALAAASDVDVVASVLPAGAPAELSRSLVLHAIARDVVPVLRLPVADGASFAAVPDVTALTGPIVVCAREGAVAVQGLRPVLEVAVPTLSPSARRRVWQAALPELGGNGTAIATSYRVEPAVAAGVAADVRAVAALDDRPITPDDVAASVHARAVVALGSGMRIVRPTATWEHLVLAPDRLGQLREAVSRVVHQARVLDEWRFLAGRSGARGVRMLLAGPPGTGKTLAAEVLAGALGVDLLVIDLARLVSKWIGETEKNLAAAFDAAERTQAALLFDEADALFGKRTEVRDAHDRYANLETAYLLTRLERFDGLAILSTNLRQNIDPAFTRRLEFIVSFEEPGAAEREALWRRHLPETAPLGDDVDLPALAASFPVVGGTVRNAAVAAAFLAAAEGSPITHRHLVRALRREYEKAGRAFPGAHARRAAI
jgi:hypothetical protein